MPDETPTSPDQTPADDAQDVTDALDSVAQAAAETAQVASEAAGEGAQSFSLPDFESPVKAAEVHDIDLLSDVALTVRIELGRSRMLVEDVLRLDSGAVVELDKLAGDPVDVYVNNRHVARGEVLVLNDNFCVRINEILSGPEEERSTG